MEISTNQIIESIEERFGLAYKPFTKFKHSGELWDQCIESVKNSDFMNKLIFANDILETPPVVVFLKTNKNIKLTTDFEKKAIGAFWGFIFKFVFEYKNQKSKSTNIGTVKTATLFYDNAEKIIII